MNVDLPPRVQPLPRVVALRVSVEPLSLCVPASIPSPFDRALQLFLWNQGREPDLRSRTYRPTVLRPGIWAGLKGASGWIAHFCGFGPKSTKMCVLTWYPPLGVRGAMYPPYVWADAAAADAPTSDAQDEVAEVCALCCHKHKTMACGGCKAPFCDECLDPHTCGVDTVYVDERGQLPTHPPTHPPT